MRTIEKEEKEKKEKNCKEKKRQTILIDKSSISATTRVDRKYMHTTNQQNSA